MYFVLKIIVSLIVGFNFTAFGMVVEKTDFFGKKIFDIIGVKVSDIGKANDYAQKNFLRKGERWDKQEDNSLLKIINEKKEIIRQLIIVSIIGL